jgi:hypothetical protein
MAVKLASELRFVFTAATAVAAVLLTSDLGAGTNAGISSFAFGCALLAS